ncbi:hypothetical protein [Streptomyces aidingensis]|uniref:Uncharacterized protein n=1 Tax=Streptomyces aidingensis TaxID=910347 RepID=A0A1I1H2C0_9ACTN|nr:hypothetical protein [Streptomyces aidingensis]SFC18299.1 hypothetical protein SAMN05421773_102232 [Streptomyces aidingensis]
MTTVAATAAVIPYITARHGEEPDFAANLGLLPGGQGLRYLAEEPGDRDAQGVLWGRVSQSRDGDRLTGAPRFAEVHPSRQREAMAWLRCQVCMRPASRTRAGWLFLESAGRSADRLEGMLTAQPPACAEHARLAAERCPHLAAGGFIAVRARLPRLYGVIGTPYRPAPGGRLEPMAADDIPVPYTDRDRLRWLVASQLVRRLQGVTVVALAPPANHHP